ncbi:phytanoyl-CoA dioxygenase family protein [Aeoliella sp.]|uniref:phytanoyl-CoA dioxygenase family protein n=1 Tax=Aeoliella sp. TaxID=2795800 RepID=UPI003CCBBA86
MSLKPLTEEQVRQYDKDGFLILRGFFTAEEIGLLRDTARRDNKLDEHAISRADGQGTSTRLALWNQPGDGVYGMFARCEHMVGLAHQLLRDEPYHYHSKMIMKEPHVGGAWEWHQDYGYWYQNGVLKPELCSVMVCVDPATQENGCLQVIKGSHLMGRVDHKQSGDQAGADLERVKAALERMELIYCELNPGDLVVFHCNTLHRSDANRSDKPRWSMICCYNARSNNPYKESHHPRYTPLDVTSRASIIEIGRAGLTDESGVDWLNPSTDTSATSLAD